MKKFLAFILSLVLVFTLVAVVACDGPQPGGNNFQEVDLEDETPKDDENDLSAREKFVNTLAEKVSVDKLVGDPSEEGWTFGLAETVKSKLNFNVDLAIGGMPAGIYTAKGDVTTSQNSKVVFKGNGPDAYPDVMSTSSITAKGNVELSEGVYALLGLFTQQGSMAGFDLATTLQGLITNFNYSVNAYVDNEVALISLSDGLYNKLPAFVTSILAQKIKISLAALSGFATYAETDGGSDSDGGADAYWGLDLEEIKAYINSIIDNVLLQYKISVSVSAVNGYALKFTVTQQSILALLETVSDEFGSDSWVTYAAEVVKQSLGADTKLELVIRLDEEGAFGGMSLESKVSFNFNVEIPNFGTLKATVTATDSVSVKKFSGTITKPSENGYTEFDLSGLLG